MDEAWCPVCDRLIPPNKSVIPDESKASTSSSSAAQQTNDRDVNATTTTPPPPKESTAVAQALAPTVTKRTRSKPGARRAVKATLMNPPPNPPAAQPATSDVPAPTQTAPSSTKAGKSGKVATKTLLTPNASLYCSEACRLQDELNYAQQGSVGGVMYSPTSSIASNSFVTPANASTGIIGSGTPAMQSRQASRSRTRSVASRTGSAAAVIGINTALANMGASASTAATTPYYLASPLLSPVPVPSTAQALKQSRPTTSHSHSHSQSRSQPRRASYSRSRTGPGSDDESRERGKAPSSTKSVAHFPTSSYQQSQPSSVFPYPHAYAAYDPDRANGDYFRSLRQGARSGYFYTTPAPAPPPPNSPSRSYVDESMAAAGLGLSTSVGGRRKHVNMGVHGMTSLSMYSGSSHRPPSSRHRSSVSASSEIYDELDEDGHSLATLDDEQDLEGTSAPAYVPANGYRSQISGLELSMRKRGQSNGLGDYPYVHPYPETDPYYNSHHHSSRSGSSASSGRRRERRRRSGMEQLEEEDDHHDSSSLRHGPSSHSHSRSRVSAARFSLDEPHYPGPQSSSPSSSSDSLRLGPRRQSTNDTDQMRGERPESMTTAPSTESVKALLSSSPAYFDLHPSSVSSSHLGADERRRRKEQSMAREDKPRPLLPRPVRVKSFVTTASVSSSARTAHMPLGALAASSPAAAASVQDSGAGTDTASNGTGATPRRPIPVRRSTTAVSVSVSAAEAAAAPPPFHSSLTGTSVPTAAIPVSRRVIHKTLPDERVGGVLVSSTAPAQAAAPISLPSFAPSSAATVDTLGAPSSSGPTSMFMSPSPSSSSAAATPVASRRSSKARRPEHQHGLLVHVALPSLASTPSLTPSHARARSLGSTLNLGALALAPTVSSVDANGTLSPSAQSANTGAGSGAEGNVSGKERNLIHELLNSVPVQNVLPPRNDHRARSESASRSRLLFQQQQQEQTAANANYVLGAPDELPAGINPSDAVPRAFAPPSGKNSAAVSRVGSSANLGPGLGVNLDTFVPTYPMELLPGQTGERRKMLFHFGGGAGGAAR